MKDAVFLVSHNSIEWTMKFWATISPLLWHSGNWMNIHCWFKWTAHNDKITLALDMHCRKFDPCFGYASKEQWGLQHNNTFIKIRNQLFIADLDKTALLVSGLAHISSKWLWCPQKKGSLGPLPFSNLKMITCMPNIISKLYKHDIFS